MREISGTRYNCEIHRQTGNSKISEWLKINRLRWPEHVRKINHYREIILVGQGLDMAVAPGRKRRNDEKKSGWSARYKLYH